MNEIVAIVEGQTEYAFVEQQLQPHFWQWNVQIRPTYPGRIYKRGGVRHWQAIKGDILRTLKERRDRVCTTMFDFYAMPADWPGCFEARKASWPERGKIMEQALHADIAQATGPNFNPARFIPYIQIHEFEALLFTNVDALAMTLSAQNPPQTQTLAQRLQAIVDEFQNPEAIDDGPETAPSKRILKLAPGYHKTLHSPIVISHTGLARLRQACVNFDRWIQRLEAAVQNPAAWHA